MDKDTVIEVSNVGFAYGSHRVLSHVDLVLKEGDYFGIVGGNGAGKTTLLKLMLGLLTPTEGNIQLASGAQLGYVPQKMTFDIHFPATVQEIVSMGRVGLRGLFRGFTAEDDASVERALKDVGMWDMRDRLIGELSGGQTQRVFIARALASQPKALFLDEPTTAIDSAAQEAFYALINTLNKKHGLAIVLVSHDIETVAREVSRIAYVENTVIHYDSPAHFMKEHSYHAHAHVHTH